MSYLITRHLAKSYRDARVESSFLSSRKTIADVAKGTRLVGQFACCAATIVFREKEVVFGALVEAWELVAPAPFKYAPPSV
jgi:hypothetical protein